MIYPSADTIEEKVGSRYSLVVLAAKRAKQIKEGAPVLIDTHSTNPLTVALEEIAAGKVTITEAADVVPQPQKTAGDGETRPLDPALDMPTLDTEPRALEDNAEDALDAEAAAA